MVYFDNAATTIIKPKKSINEVINSIKNHGNPGRGGYPLSLNAAQKIFNSRLATANFFNSNSPERVVFTANATMSLNIAIKCFFNHDSHIIISCFEHNSVYRPVEKLKKTSNIKYNIFDVSLDNDEETIKNAVNLINENTGMIIITHVSNVCGKILPVRDIIKKAKEKKPDIIAIVDAAQSAGTLDIDINRDNIDILCVPAHKGLMGICGIGIMIFGDNLNIDEIMPTTILEGGTGINSLDTVMPADLPEHFEAGTPNTPAISALLASVEYIREQSLEKIYFHEKILYDKTIEILKSFKNIDLYSDFTSNNYIGSILFNIKNYKCEETARILNKNQIFVRDGYHCSPLAHTKLGTIDTGGVRISFSYHNTLKEIDKFYRVIKNL
ncbi:MAG: aminotransferase class V-fold PLP-dependent enzyme [Oscillospiraceae bacterium]|nr:aminotransferase class V-fold PLP-dependent enzyme [Oscillospiraceae bacterium]